MSGMASLPICTVCPRCGNEGFHQVKPRAWVYFKPDRLCTRCPTYYSPPTPRWAPVLFVVGGGLLAGVCGAVGSLCAARGIELRNVYDADAGGDWGGLFRAGVFVSVS